MILKKMKFIKFHGLNPFVTFNGAAVDVREWISNSILNFTGPVMQVNLTDMPPN